MGGDRHDTVGDQRIAKTGTLTSIFCSFGGLDLRYWCKVKAVEVNLYGSLGIAIGESLD